MNDRDLRRWIKSNLRVQIDIKVNIFKPTASGKDSFDCVIPSEVPGSNQQVHLEYGSLDMDVAAHGVDELLS